MTMNFCTVPLSYNKGTVAMDEKSDRKELQRRLQQAKRMITLSPDVVTRERLQKLVEELEEQLQASE